MALHATTTLHQLDCNDHMEIRYDDDQVVNLSRLSVCTSSCIYGDNSAEFYENGAGSLSMFMSQLSIESFEGDADDEELSNEEKNYKLETSLSDSEPEFYSLPATPPRIQRKSGNKDCVSENEAKKCTRDARKTRKRRMEGKKGLLNQAENCKTGGIKMGYSGGESDSGGVMLIARPKGGRRSMCMDLEEVKACRDLGLELEMPSRVSISAASALDTSSGGNSPIAHCYISSPGDDPRHVKARLKRWAQAVALTSTPPPTIS